MEIEQILIRPKQNKYILQYSDGTGRGNSLVLDAAVTPKVAALVADAQQRLPAPQDRPDKDVIQRQITQLEGRLKALKESIGVPV